MLADIINRSSYDIGNGEEDKNDISDYQFREQMSESFIIVTDMQKAS